MCTFRVKERERERKRETKRVRERENMCVWERESGVIHMRYDRIRMLWVSFAKEPYKRDNILQTRPIDPTTCKHPIERESGVQVLHVGPRVCVTWRIHICDMTHSYAWHDSFICVTWLIESCHKSIVEYRARLRKMTCTSTPLCTDSRATNCMQTLQPKRQHNTGFSDYLSTWFQRTDMYAPTHACTRGGGLGSRPKNMYGETLGDGVEYHLMKPTPRR